MSKVSLTSICNIETGKLDSSAAKERGKYPFFTCAPEPLKISSWAFNEDAILLAGNNAQGNFHCQRYNGKFNAYQRTYIITVKEGYDINYVYYNLKIHLSHLAKMSQGSQTKFLTKKILDSFLIEDVPLSEQKKMSYILASLDSKIENNNRINNALEAMAKTIYDYWFLQFDFPDENGKPYKSSGGKMVWNEELGREIPVGWKRGYLREYIGEEKGGDWGKDAPEGNYNTEVSCIRGADFPSAMGSKSLEAPIRYILSKNMYKVLKSGDIIVEISGGSPTQSTGRICYINEELLERFENDVITSNFCKAFSLTRSNILYWFYIFWCKLYESKVFFNYESKTTGIKNLLFDTLCEDYSIILPANKIIELYQERVSSMFEKIQKNLKENQELASLRDFLLPLLMNGQVKFKDE